MVLSQVTFVQLALNLFFKTPFIISHIEVLQDGIQIARRTNAKDSDAEGILTSSICISVKCYDVLIAANHIKTLHYYHSLNQHEVNTGAPPINVRCADL